MTLQFHNTLTKKKEEFLSIAPNKAKIYACGPTVYNYVHLGNLRAYVFYDLVVRYLRYKGYEVTFVSNITDVDDKTIKGSKDRKQTLNEFTDAYTKEYITDLKTLNISAPDIMPKATSYIAEMVEMIKKLVKNGYAYEKDGSYYFKVSSFKDYGKIANIDLSNLKTNADGRLTDEYEKDDARDFALWKAYNAEDGDVFWETEIGKGRPGWHIECSAMSTKILGCPFDIHLGGIDLIFPHHTNEIAQSEGACKSKFVNYWMHNEHLIVNGEKMSKSLGNFFTLKDLIKKGYDPKAIRYQLLSTHYRQKLNFTEKSLEQIPNTLKRFYEFIDRLQEADGEDIEGNGEIEDIITQTKIDFEKALDDDLNISSALACVFDFMRETNKLIDENKVSKKNAVHAKHLMENFDKVLGVLEYEKEAIPNEILELSKMRQKARDKKDFAESDRIRDLLKEKGYAIDDKDKGAKIKKID